jgi:hypothetical protein
MRNRLLFALVLGLVASSYAGTASAAGPVLREKVTSANFVVHYTTDAATPDAIAPATAQLVADNAEKSLAAEEAAFGFDPPLTGSDGHIDIYVYSFRRANADGLTSPLSPDADQSESSIFIGVDKAQDLSVVAHEVFHVLQDSVWVLGGGFLDEATAEWAQQRTFPSEGFSVDLDPGVPLDCVDAAVCPQGGYQSWSFFEFLAERHGPRVVREIFDQARNLRVNRTGETSLTAIGAALAAHGATLGDAFRDFALANIDGDYTLGQLQGSGIGGLTDAKALRTGSSSGKVPRRRTTVDHLATSYIPVTGGGGKRKGRCRKATLRLNVSGPTADAAAGYVVGSHKATRVALVGGRGSVTLRSWSTCSKSELTLALINTGVAGDGRAFAVTGRVTAR